MGNLVGHVTSLLTSLPAPLALTIIGALVFAEAALFVGFVLPGETAVLFGGALAAAGHLSFTALVVVVVLAAIVGDSVGYEVGRQFGPRLLETRPLRRHRARIEVARTRLRDKGAVTVVAGRFTALLRAVTPGLCGMSRMPYRRFLLFNAAGWPGLGDGRVRPGVRGGQVLPAGGVEPRCLRRGAAPAVRDRRDRRVAPGPRGEAGGDAVRRRGSGPTTPEA